MRRDMQNKEQQLQTAQQQVKAQALQKKAHKEYD